MPPGQDLTNGGNALLYKRRITGDYSGIERPTGTLSNKTLHGKYESINFNRLVLITQAQLTELQADNERLTEEKGVLLESLCRQTEKLEDSRSKVDTLQGLLLREEQPQEASKGYNTEREQKLVDLLKVSALNLIV